MFISDEGEGIFPAFHGLHQKRIDAAGWEHQDEE
jgi:hypothetical protein